MKMKIMSIGKIITTLLAVYVILVCLVFVMDYFIFEEKVEVELTKSSDMKNLSEFEKTDFIPTLEHKIDTSKNAVYCASLLFAWDEIRNLINQPITISPNDNDLLLLHNSTSFMNVLKSDEYAVTSEINGNRIRTKAKFFKPLPFETKLTDYGNSLTFKGQAIFSFGINGYNDYSQLRTIQIVYYKNDNNFIIKLFPKNTKHEIILFKTDKVFNSMAEMNEEIIKLSEIGKKEQQNENQEWKYNIEEGDEIVIPKFNFDIQTNFKTLGNKNFKTAIQDYRIDKVEQRTAFILDENGAEIKSKAEIEWITLSAIEETPTPQKMFFDKDFLILLKRTDAQNPYFGLWVTNTELMVK